MVWKKSMKKVTQAARWGPRNPASQKNAPGRVVMRPRSVWCLDKGRQITGGKVPGGSGRCQPAPIFGAKNQNRWGSQGPTSLVTG